MGCSRINSDKSVQEPIGWISVAWPDVIVSVESGWIFATVLLLAETGGRKSAHWGTLVAIVTSQMGRLIVYGPGNEWLPRGHLSWIG